MLLFWPIRILSYLLTLPIYWFIKFGLAPSLRFIGYKRSTVGVCTILAPMEHMETILYGLEYLQSIDPQMFQMLTAAHRYVFWYHKNRYLRCREFFTITDNFLSWGKEGVITCFVQSVTDSQLINPYVLNERKTITITRQQIQQCVFEWLTKHSFPPELIEQYKEMTDIGHK